MTKYIDEREFYDFKENFKLLVNTFNHSITDLKEDVKKIKDDNCKQGKSLSSMQADVAVIKNSVTNSSKVVWWIMGIMGAIAVAAIIGTVLGK